MERNVFEDLEIDVDLMMDDPEEFSKQAHEAADKLRRILTTKSSIREATQVARMQAAKNSKALKTATSMFEELTEDLYEDSESMELDELYHYTQLLAGLVKDLETAFHSRARNEMIKSNPTVEDKKLAFHQYKKLRDSFELYRDFSKLLMKHVVSPIPAMTGNYGGSTTQTYPAYVIGDDTYHNHRAVARKLGYDPDDVKTHMDLVELINENNIEDVKIVEVEL